MDRVQGNHEVVYTSYADFVIHLSKRCPQYEFLSHFFSHNPTSSKNRMNLWIADSEHGGLEEKIVQLDLVHNVPSSVKTRLVLIEYTESWNIDRSILDRICLNLDVPPYFLWQHFDHHELWSEIGHNRFGMGCKIRRIPASRQISLEIGDFGASHASFLVLRPSGNPAVSIVLILIREDQHRVNEVSYKPYDVPGPRSAPPMKKIPEQKAASVAETYKQSLFNMDDGSILSADNNPLEYAIPFIDITLQAISHDVEDLRYRTTQLNNGLWTEEGEFREEWTIMNWLSTTIDTAREQLQYLVTKNGAANSKLFHRVLIEIDTVKKDLDDVRATQRDLIQREVGIMALQESRKSIKEARSVRNLSQLAYVFIPLAYSTSLFGMNVTAVRNAHLSTFVITSVVTLTLSLLSLWILPAMPSPPWEALKSWLKCLILLARCSPVSAIVLGSFIVVHSRDVVEEVFRELGLNTILLYGYDQYLPPPDRFQKLKIKSSAWSKFWLRRIEQVAILTSKRGWQDDFFWLRRKTRGTDGATRSDA